MGPRASRTHLGGYHCAALTVDSSEGRSSERQGYGDSTTARRNGADNDGSTEPQKMEQTPMADKLRHERVHTTRPVDRSDTRTHIVADADGGHRRSTKNGADTNAGQR